LSTVIESPQTYTPPAADVEVAWPTKRDLFGVQISVTDYDELVDAMLRAAKLRVPAVVSFHAVHAVIEATRDPKLLATVNRFDAIAPDGQPIRWALNHLYRVGLKERVYGPETMARLCERAAHEYVPVYLYGGSQQVIDALLHKLPRRFPRLQIVGAESPPFRALTLEEDAAVVERINDSGAGIVFIGLGCPKQDHFAGDHAGRICAVQACVGAAFDFHAGTKAMAPQWMQRNGLEWLYRLASEPRRLWKRYLNTNSVFVAKWMIAAVRKRLQVPTSRDSKTPVSNQNELATTCACD
jgi:N-acetylglucosaminyldiphosphoundecaprenol N-acetyl-beta-D-mannosaminyltransferase